PRGEHYASLGGGEADPVSQEVEDRLPHLGSVQVLVRDLLVELHLQIDLPGGRERADAVERLARDLVHVLDAEVEQEPPRLEPGQVENVVDETHQALRFAPKAR